MAAHTERRRVRERWLDTGSRARCTAFLKTRRAKQHSRLLGAKADVQKPRSSKPLQTQPQTPAKSGMRIFGGAISVIYERKWQRKARLLQAVGAQCAHNKIERARRSKWCSIAVSLKNRFLARPKPFLRFLHSNSFYTHFPTARIILCAPKPSPSLRCLL